MAASPRMKGPQPQVAPGKLSQWPDDSCRPPSKPYRPFWPAHDSISPWLEHDRLRVLMSGRAGSWTRSWTGGKAQDGSGCATRSIAAISGHPLVLANSRSRMSCWQRAYRASSHERASALFRLLRGISGWVAPPGEVNIPYMVHCV